MKRKALCMILSAKAENNLILILDKIILEQPKTKILAKIIKNFKGDSFLLVLPKDEKDVILAARNLPETKTIGPENLNVLDVLSFKYLIILKEAIKMIKGVFSENKKLQIEPENF